jgi:hypothetical protein
MPFGCRIHLQPQAKSEPPKRQEHNMKKSACKLLGIALTGVALFAAANVGAQTVTTIYA